MAKKKPLLGHGPGAQALRKELDDARRHHAQILESQVSNSDTSAVPRASLEDLAAPDAPNPSRLGVMNNAFADITSAIAALGDLDDLVKYGAETQRPEVEAAKFGNVAALMSNGSEELTLLAQRIRQLTNSIHSNLF